MGAILGSGIGGIGTFKENLEVTDARGLRKVSPFMIPNMLVDSAAGKIAIDFNLQVRIMPWSGLRQRHLACGEAFKLIRRGDGDVMVPGGAEAALLPITVAAFDMMGALSQLDWPIAHAGASAGEPDRADRTDGRRRRILETVGPDPQTSRVAVLSRCGLRAVGCC